MMDENPDDDGVRLMRRFSLAVVDNPDMIDSIIEYWFSNNYRSLTFIPHADQKEKAALVRNAEQIIKSRMETLVLLDMVLPNGKKLRDATGAECARFAPKVGKLLKKVAEKVRPTQIVGEVLSEGQLKKLYS